MLKTVRERRGVQRFKLDRMAKVQVPGSLPRDCLIVDVSDSGIRIHAEHWEVPDEFLIVISGARHERRECRVVWRLGFEVGAEFIDVRPDFAQSVVSGTNFATA
jgi:hypothetical protein